MSSKGVSHAVLIKAGQIDAAATDAAIAPVTRSTEVLTPIVDSAAGKGAVDAYREASHYFGDPTAWV